MAPRLQKEKRGVLTLGALGQQATAHLDCLEKLLKSSCVCHIHPQGHRKVIIYTYITLYNITTSTLRTPAHLTMRTSPATGYSPKDSGFQALNTT